LHAGACALVGLFEAGNVLLLGRGRAPALSLASVRLLFGLSGGAPVPVSRADGSAQGT
jgi:hypothetical protein